MGTSCLFSSRHSQLCFNANASEKFSHMRSIRSLASWLRSTDFAVDNVHGPCFREVLADAKYRKLGPMVVVAQMFSELIPQSLLLRSSCTCKVSEAWPRGCFNADVH